MKRTLKRLGFYYLLLAISILFCSNLIPDKFPTRNLSVIYLLPLSVCLVLYYFHRVSPTGGLSAMMKALSFMAPLLILLRCIKYSAVSEIGILARHTWYMYYIPILLIPLLLFGISLLVSSKSHKLAIRIWYLPLIITIAMIVLVMTNDLHFQAFSFNPGFKNWDGDYTYGWLFYAVNVWQFGLSLAAIAILIVKCRVGTAKKNAWVILIPFGIGALLYALLLTGNMPQINGSHIIEFPEAHIFTAAAVLECCMQLGLIPTNNDYGKLFNNLSIAAQIIDQDGKPVYASSHAVPLSHEQLSYVSGSRIGKHTAIHIMKLQGGNGIWQVDLTELDRLNEQLKEAKESLAEESELIRLQGDLKKRQTVIEQRTIVYDEIARCTQKQSQAISQIAKDAEKATDPSEKEACRRKITWLGSYIKRYANLMLLSRETEVLSSGELALSLAEVLHYLNYCGIAAEYVDQSDAYIKSGAALATFESFETIIENNYSFLSGVFVNLSGKKNAVIKITFEHLTQPPDKALLEKLTASDVKIDMQCEDDVTYVCFTAKGVNDDDVL